MKVAKKAEKNDKTKVIVLNSGGFDSTVLLHYVSSSYGESAEVYSVFFDYGQLSATQEREKSLYNANLVGVKDHIEITLPPFYWTRSNFYGEGFERESQYLEYRNLVFLSYAFSLAQSLGADTIYTALLGCTEEEHYADCSRSFLNSVNSISPNIRVEAPFSELTKEELFPLAFFYGIGPSDFHSCDVPKEGGVPCGECLDCKSLEKVEESLSVNSPIKAYIKGKFEDFYREYTNINPSDPYELRVIINDSCQLSCPHCFHGGVSVTGDPLTLSEWEGVVSDALISGFKSLHFGGKEPLYDSYILYFLSMVDRLEYKLDKFFSEIGIATNGINFLKYAEELKRLGVTKIYFSVDEALGKGGMLLHSTLGLYEKNISTAIRLGFDVEVYVDLHEKNWDCIPALLKSLENVGVKSAFIRTVRNVGNAESIEPLSLDKVDRAVTDAMCYDSSSLSTMVSIGMYYTYAFLNSSEYYKTTELINMSMMFQTTRVNEHMSMYAELFCGRFSDSITITSDGYALGCGCEVSNSCYAKESVGNVRDHSLLDLVILGKEKTARDNEPYFENLTYKDCLSKKSV